ncbi:MAG: cell division protein FtsX, partial [Citromicrobium sp.]|nr:cell division protein FtsX [Citromicrobium sp.]
PWLGARLGQQRKRDFLDSLMRLYAKPLGSLLTAAVIGITLALPAGLWVALKNVDAVSLGWQGSLQASLFLRDTVTPEAGRALTRRISQRDGVTRTRYISRDEALAEFRELSGFGDALDIVADNPLPATIVVQPDTALGPMKIDAMLRSLAALPEVDRAQMDQAWLNRLYAMLDVLRRAVFIIALLLGLAVLFIVGNTIRLDIENRREEIRILRLLGATDGFIRRPFLYAGFWYGLAGGVLAWLLLVVALLALGGPVRHLAGLYDSGFVLSGLGFTGSMALLGCGIVLGWLGSALTVSRRLSAIQPR